MRERERERTAEKIKPRGFLPMSEKRIGPLAIVAGEERDLKFNKWK